MPPRTRTAESIALRVAQVVLLPAPAGPISSHRSGRLTAASILELRPNGFSELREHDVERLAGIDYRCAGAGPVDLPDLGGPGADVILRFRSLALHRDLGIESQDEKNIRMCDLPVISAFGIEQPSRQPTVARECT